MKYCLVDTIPNVPGSMPFLFKVLRDDVGQLEKIVWEDPNNCQDNSASDHQVLTASKWPVIFMIRNSLVVVSFGNIQRDAR